MRYALRFMVVASCLMVARELMAPGHGIVAVRTRLMARRPFLMSYYPHFVLRLSPGFWQYAGTT